MDCNNLQITIRKNGKPVGAIPDQSLEVGDRIEVEQVGTLTQTVVEVTQPPVSFGGAK